MWIVVSRFDNTSHTLEVNASDLASVIHAAYEHASGAQSGSYFLTYGGKQINGTDTISSLGVQEGSILHVVPDASASQTIPSPCVCPSREEVALQIKRWEAVVGEEDCENKMHILDPETHYARLKFLEMDVVENSELFLCAGHYDLTDNEITPPNPESVIYRPVPPFVASLLELRLLGVSPEYNKDLQDTLHGIQSLRKSYLIMSRVVASFNYLSTARFCGLAFTVLVQCFGREIAKVVRISETLIVSIHNGMQEALTNILGQDLSPDMFYTQLLAHVEPPLWQLMDLLEISHNLNDMISTKSILEICRTASIFIDLGLVCYVGSHGRRFDLEHLEKDLDGIAISSLNISPFNFVCKRGRLACLDKLFDQGEVWTFEFSTGATAPAHQKFSKTERLWILTTIEDFVDIWGPAWAISSDQQHPENIDYYQLTRGVIYAEKLMKESTNKDWYRCHWTTSSDFHRRRETSLLRDQSFQTLALNALLLIGATLRENRNCRGTVRDFEIAHGHEMNPLGTRRSRWVLDSATASVSVSKVVAISGQSTYKLQPQLSLKERMVAEWKMHPESAQVIIFHQYHAVEVSHCTGNARRTQLRNVFLMPPVQDLLDRIHPNWRQKGWGPRFLQALHDPDPADMIAFSKGLNHKQKKQFGMMVSVVLDTLGQSGLEGDQFNVAFLNRYLELYLPISTQCNDWAKILQDTWKTAVYAIVSDKCLEAYTYTHSTATCNGRPAFTILHTIVGGGFSLSNASYVEINPSGHIYQEEKAEVGSKIAVMTLVSPLKNPFASVFHRIQKSTMGEFFPMEFRELTYEVFIRASKESSSGWSRPRPIRQSLPGAEFPAALSCGE